ncbi:hypothetical protein ACFFLM_11070 [Deinococcus oregonensis]|uniref:DUF4138 domain-containing protein n=1 Tax=Deinococcus oregonensis TaxID=1805970 RepID=A0ABV6AYE3_9DEIO
MKKFMLLAALLTGTGVAQSQTLFINGVALQAKPVQLNGETYYQFRASDLTRVGAITAGGISPNIQAIKGCVGDTLFNGVYTVQLLKVLRESGRFGVTVKVSNASKKELYNFMLFSPSDVKAATGTGQALDLNNYETSWVEKLLPGANITLTTYNDTVAAKGFTRLLIRPKTDALEEIREAKLPLAKVYNMEFDLTCQKK